LLVDDEEDMRNLLADFLSGDYKILTANNGEEAVKRVGEEKPGLVLLDLQMPKMDGLEALSQIKKIDPNIVVIMVTGYGAKGAVDKAMILGAYDYIPKPFNLEKLKEKIKQALTSKLPEYQNAQNKMSKL
jgi:DNA-binding NtrC family response regulator